MNEDFLKLASCFHVIFSSDQGKAVLASLAENCNKSHLEGNQFFDMSVNLNPDQFMFIREGQDSVLRHIVRMMKYYEENRDGIVG